MKLNPKAVFLLVLLITLASPVLAKVSRTGQQKAVVPASTPPKTVAQLKDCIIAKAKADGVKILSVTLSGKNLKVTYLKSGATKAELKAENGLICRYIAECLANSRLRSRIRCRKVIGRSKPPGSGEEAIADPPSGGNGGGSCNCKPSP